MVFLLEALTSAFAFTSAPPVSVRQRLPDPPPPPQRTYVIVERPLKVYTNLYM